MPALTVGEIVELVGGDYRGPAGRAITGVATLTEAGERDLTFLENPKYIAVVSETRAGAVLVPRTLEGDDERWIRVTAPRVALGAIIERWFARRQTFAGISPLASVAPSARLGSNVAVGPFAAIGDDVVIGDNVTISPHVSVGAGAVIGNDCLIYANVSIYDNARIGNRCIIHSGATIGSDGYGFAIQEGRHRKIPQIGIVRIEDDVEIGANSCVDRAALGETVIGEGTKVDNLVQIGHNVKIGKHCLLIGQVGISGSTELGDYVIMAGQAGASGHLKIGSYAQIAGGSGVFDDVPERTKVFGCPARPLREYMGRERNIKKVPALLKRIEALEKALGKTPAKHDEEAGDEG
ncbi:MAG TPA: UDP-3-O-(3-hydroxymyristoyl)glucosamine N-acyltransferase [Thermoanaerobaculia bacterium]|nr:UDP-3-O-(3-hydroxymyristoyl)glucosamine N-acyltransferase [Thermoanaerobaculia bacterium]